MGGGRGAWGKGRDGLERGGNDSFKVLELT